MDRIRWFRKEHKERFEKHRHLSFNEVSALFKQVYRLNRELTKENKKYKKGFYAALDHLNRQRAVVFGEHRAWTEADFLE